MNKVLFVFHDADYYSGATRSMIDLLSRMDRTKIGIHCLFPCAGSATEFLTSIDIPCVCMKYFNMRCSISEAKSIKSKCKGIIKHVVSMINLLLKLNEFQKINFDYIYTNTSAIYIGYYLSKLLRCKHIWHVREFGILDQERISYGGEKKVYSKIQQADQVIAISSALRTHLINQGIARDKIKLVYDDVNYNAFNDVPKILSHKEEVIALSCGAIQKNKGHLLAIKAIEKLNRQGVRIKLKIAGNTNTEYYPTLAQYVQANGLENVVEFCGFVQKMDLLRQKCTIGIVASSSEAFGRVTIEGMLSKMVMVGANAAGTAELIEHGVTGFLFDNGQLDSLCDQLTYVTSHLDEMSEITSRAYQSAIKFTQSNATRLVESLLFDEGKECVCNM